MEYFRETVLCVVVINSDKKLHLRVNIHQIPQFIYIYSLCISVCKKTRNELFSGDGLEKYAMLVIQNDKQRTTLNN